MPGKTTKKAAKKTTKKTAKKNQNKTVATKASVTEFINSIEDPVKKADCKTLLKVMKRITGKQPKMWGGSIVGFDEYHYKYDSGREGDMCMTGFSPRASALTMYIMMGFENRPDLMKKLGKYKTGKSCLYVKKLDDIDMDVLEELIEIDITMMREKYG